VFLTTSPSGSKVRSDLRLNEIVPFPYCADLHWWPPYRFLVQSHNYEMTVLEPKIKPWGYKFQAHLYCTACSYDFLHAMCILITCLISGLFPGRLIKVGLRYGQLFTQLPHSIHDNRVFPTPKENTVTKEPEVPHPTLTLLNFGHSGLSFPPLFIRFTCPSPFFFWATLKDNS
jgi:hypothetical protein